MPESQVNGLGKICESFEIEVENLHRSDYDAYLTMRVAKKICEYRKVSMEELLEICPNCYYSVDKGVVVNHYVTVSYSKNSLITQDLSNPIPRFSKKAQLKT